MVFTHYQETKSKSRIIETKEDKKITKSYLYLIFFEKFPLISILILFYFTDIYFAHYFNIFSIKCRAYIKCVRDVPIFYLNHHYIATKKSNHLPYIQRVNIHSM